jgi:hypothetical protein
MTIDAGPTPSGSAPKRTRSDYHQYYWDTCRKLAPRYRDWDNRAYESLLALLMFDHAGKTEVDCIIALARMGLYAPVLSSKSRTG